MATSGFIHGDALSGERVYMNWQLASQNIPGNYSTINWQVGWLYPVSTCRGLRAGVAVMNDVLIYQSSGSGDNVHAFSSSHLSSSTDHPVLQTAAGSLNIGHSSDGTKAFTAAVSMRGWEGGGPNFESNGADAWALPTIPRNPNAPSTPVSIGRNQVSILIQWSPNPADGLPNTSYIVSYATAAEIIDEITVGGTSTFLTGLDPGVTYYFKVKGVNSVGEGPFSLIGNDTTMAGARVNDSGTWRQAIPYVRDGGTWKIARPWIKYVGEWKESQ